MGVTTSGRAKGYAYWSVRCKNGKSYVVQIPPNVKSPAVVADCRVAARHRPRMLQEILRAMRHPLTNASAGGRPNTTARDSCPSTAGRRSFFRPSSRIRWRSPALPGSNSEQAASDIASRTKTPNLIAASPCVGSRRDTTGRFRRLSAARRAILEPQLWRLQGDAAAAGTMRRGGATAAWAASGLGGRCRRELKAFDDD